MAKVGMNKLCRECGGRFIPTGSDKSCSSCRIRRWEEHQSSLTKVCVECGVTFVVTHRGRKYCSEQCQRDLYNRYAREHRAKQPNPERKKRRDHPQYLHGYGIYRKLKLESMTELRCERCRKDVEGVSKTGEPLGVVHHKDNNDWNNVDENLELLCQSCHHRHHNCTLNLQGSIRT